MVFALYTVFLGASILFVNAQITSAPIATPTLGSGPLPLTQYTFTYPNVPEQVNPFPVGRGPQSGYNICNSTTEGPSSLCQTMFFNTIQDFCLWGSPTPNSVVGNVEAVVVAYCTKPGHGTRLIAPGILTAVQFIKAPGYIQVTGLFNQTGIGLTTDDGGGELDPHGADLAGNPLGGLVFSNNLPSSTSNTTIVQVQNWSNFVGSNMFCFKACDPTVTSPDFCQNIYDTQGCFFNMPASYEPNVFSSCLGDNQNPPGGAPVIPATSSCTTYASSDLYPNAATSTATSVSTKPASTASHSGTAAAATSGTSGVATVTQFSAGFFAMVSTITVAAFAGMVFVL
jgi:hypothetical protein